MFSMTPLRTVVAVIGAAAFAVLLALAAFSTDAAAEKTGKSAEKTDTTAEQTAAAAKEEPITIENHAWSNYHWAHAANPLRLQLGDNVDSSWDAYLKTASSDWNQVPSTMTWTDMLETTVGPGNVSATQLKRKKCPPTSGMVEVCNTTFGNTGWSGLAQIWLNNGHISAGTAKMNDTYIKPADGYKKNHVMCQEIGHTFGLGHQDESGASLGTCMDYSNTASDEGRHPNSHDYEELQKIYNHFETSSSTSSQLPAAAKRGNYNTKDEWGKLKHRDTAGKHEIYERDFKDGTKLVTFVEVEEQEDQPPQKKQEKKQGQ